VLIAAGTLVLGAGGVLAASCVAATLLPAVVGERRLAATEATDEPVTDHGSEPIPIAA